ncbi:MAG: TetR/AcrR family transcriptional regulator [Porticoccaceae bacterium]
MSKTRWGKTVQSKDEQYELKRMAILRTAGRLFNQKGFRATSLNDLASELEVTKPTLYYYIENKEDILFQCLLTAITHLLEQTDTVMKSPKLGIDKLTDFIHLFVSTFDDEFGRCLAHPGWEPLSPKYLAKIDPLYQQLDIAMRQMIEDGKDDDSMRACNPKITAFTIFGAINWMTRWYQVDGEMNTHEIAEEMAALFCSGLQNQKT